MGDVAGFIAAQRQALQDATDALRRAADLYNPSADQREQLSIHLAQVDTWMTVADNPAVAADPDRLDAWALLGSKIASGGADLPSTLPHPTTAAPLPPLP